MKNQNHHTEKSEEETQSSNFFFLLFVQEAFLTFFVLEGYCRDSVFGICSFLSSSNKSFKL